MNDPIRVRRRALDGARGFYACVAAVAGLPAALGGLLLACGRNAPDGAASGLFRSAVVAALACAALYRWERSPKSASSLGLSAIALAAYWSLKAIVVGLARDTAALDAIDLVVFALFVGAAVFALRAALGFHAAARRS